MAVSLNPGITELPPAAPAAAQPAAPVAGGGDAATQAALIQQLTGLLAQLQALLGAQAATGGGLPQPPVQQSAAQMIQGYIQQSPMQSPMQFPMPAPGPGPAPAPAPGPAPVPAPAPTTGGPNITLVGAREGDAQLIANVGQALASTPTGQALVGRLAQGRPVQVQFLDPLEIAVRAPGAEALYSHMQDTVFISRKSASEDPRRAAYAFAHEAVHHLHDDLLDQARYASMSGQEKAQVSLATETEAYMVGARIMRELGGRPAGAVHGLNADGSYASFAQTFAQLLADPTYNPTGAQFPASYYQRVLAA